MISKTNSKDLWLVLLMFMMSLTARGQYDPSFTNYWAMSSFYNPSTIAQDGMLNFTGAVNMQLVGFENAPSTMYANVDLPIIRQKTIHGLGAGFMNDQIGLFKHQKFYLQYAYNTRLWGGRISGGVHIGMLSETFDGSDLDLGEANDPAFPTSEANGSAFDLGFGFQYAAKNWFTGFSMMHCTSPVVELGDEKVNELSISPSYYLMGGYNKSLKNPFYKVYTYAMLRTDAVGFRADMTARLAYNGDKFKMYGGLSYSPTNSVSFLFGGDFHGINIGYAYEMYTSAIGAFSGSHEIIIGYKTELNLFKKGKNKHKSVRIL